MKERTYDERVEARKASNIASNMVFNKRGQMRDNMKCSPYAYTDAKHELGGEVFFDSIIDRYNRVLSSENAYRYNPIIDFHSGGVEKNNFDTISWQNRALVTLSFQKNFNRICKFATKRIQEKFGENALTEYGIGGNLRMNSLPEVDTQPQSERYLFMHSNEYLRAIIQAPKVAVEKWKVTEGENNTKTLTQRCIMNIDGQILLGATIVSLFPKDADKNNGIRFDVFYRGLEEGQFRVESWDFMPPGQHLNTFIGGKNVAFLNGIEPENTRFSHVHRRTLRQRVIFGSRRTCDVIATPINRDPYKFERKYNSFNDMCNNFFDQYQISNKILDQDLVNTVPLKELGLMYCPMFSVAQKKVAGDEILSPEQAEFFDPVTKKSIERFNVCKDSTEIEEDWSPMQEAGQQTLRFKGLRSPESEWMARQLWRKRVRENDLSSEIPFGMER